MEKKSTLTIKCTPKQIKEVRSFCELNNLQVENFVDTCFTTGFNIERYGTLGGQTDRIIEKEIIVEKPIEVIKEIEIIKYVDREIIKEVPIEKIVHIYEKKEDNDVTNLTDNCDKFKVKLEQIQKTVSTLQQAIKQKDNEISKLQKTIEDINNIKPPTKGQFLRTSNIDDNL